MNNIEQHSEVVQLNSTSNVDIDTSTTTFEDNSQSIIVGKGIKLNSSIITENVELIEFLSRPIKISSGSAVATTSTFDPFALYFNNAAVIRKLANYKFIRATLNVRYSESAMPFVYGRRIMAAAPNGFSYSSFVRNESLTQLSHVLIDPTKNNPYVVSIPFFSTQNYYTISELLGFGPYVIVIRNIVNYRRADSDTAADVQYSVHCWLTDVELATPIATSITLQSSEFTGVISYPASVVSSAAKALESVPVLKPMATTVKIAAECIAKFSALFGFSKPLQLQPPVPFSNNANHNMYVSTYLDPAQKLTLDPKQEVVVSTTTIDGSEIDNLAFSNFHKRLSLVNIFTWNQTQEVDTLVGMFPVTPLYMKTHISNGDVIMSPCATPAMFFKQWRGSMIYNLSMVCSKFHKGRLRILWSPNQLAFPLTEPLSNQVESVVVDITTDSELTFTVNWGWHSLYKLCIPTTTQQTTDFNIGAYNGYIYIFVHQELTAPIATANAEILVHMKAHDNMQYAMPSLQNIQLFHSTTATIAPPTGIITYGSLPNVIYPPFDPATIDTSTPTNPYLPITFQSGLFEVITKPKTYEFNVAEEENNNQNLAIGESFLSFRTLCKAYWPVFTGYESSAAAVGEPANGYFTLNQLPFSPDPITPAGAPHEFIITPITWLTRNFLGYRGSTRYKIIFDNPIISAKVTLMRGSQAYYKDTLTDYGFTQYSMTDGNGIAIDLLNNSISFEVPFESPNRFHPCHHALFNGKGPNINRVMIQYNYHQPAGQYFTYRVFVSMGEDLNFVSFTGAGENFIYSTMYTPA